MKNLKLLITLGLCISLFACGMQEERSRTASTRSGSDSSSRSNSDDNTREADDDFDFDANVDDENDMAPLPFFEPAPFQPVPFVPAPSDPDPQTQQDPDPVSQLQSCGGLGSSLGYPQSALQCFGKTVYSRSSCPSGTRDLGETSDCDICCAEGVVTDSKLSCGQLGASLGYAQSDLECYGKQGNQERTTCQSGYKNLGEATDCQSCCAK